MRLIHCKHSVNGAANIICRCCFNDLDLKDLRVEEEFAHSRRIFLLIYDGLGPVKDFQTKTCNSPSPRKLIRKGYLEGSSLMSSHGFRYVNKISVQLNTHVVSRALNQPRVSICFPFCKAVFQVKPCPACTATEITVEEEEGTNAIN